ncbi:MAG TPA: hypothetical protein VK060_17900 [Ruania sp.]|nr:hypothetical protein [Ruania sp.]
MSGGSEREPGYDVTIELPSEETRVGSASRTPEEWARTVDLAPPVHWGDVEDEILRCEPVVEKSTADTVVRAIGFVVVAILAIPSFGSSVLGLILFLLGVNAIILRVLFALAIGTAVVMLIFWWEDRGRGPVKLLVAGGSGAVSLVTYLLMRAAPEAQGDGWAALFMILAAVAGLGGAVVMLLGGKAEQERRQRRRWSLNPGRDAAYVRARRHALEILVERGVVRVDEDRRRQMAEMPLGTWHTIGAASQR